MVDPERIERAKNYPIIDLARNLGIDVSKNNTCRCINPMHDDKNPSMSFDPRTNLYKCFSCEYGGDTIELVMEVNKCSFIEAIDYILGPNSKQTSAHIQNTIKTPLKSLKSTLKEDGQKYTDIYEYFIDLLPHPDDKHYLVTGRNLTVDTLKENKIKTIDADKTWEYKDKLLNLFPIEKLIKSGLILLSKNQKPYLFFFKCTSIIPFYKDGQVIFLQGVNSNKIRKEPKYLNLIGIKKPNLYFPRNFTAYNSKKDAIHIVESAIDTLSALTLGYKAVGIVDAGIKTFSEFNKLKQFPIILIGDFDSAGFDAKIRIYKYLQENDFNIFSVSIIKLVDGLVKQGLIKQQETKSIKDMNDILKLLKREKFNDKLK